MKLKKIAIIGASGYTGRELLKILARHKYAKITHITSESNQNQPLENLHPELKNIYDYNLTFEKYNWKNIKKDTDVVFLCLPHATSMNIAKQMIDEGKIVIDLSADFRIKDPKIYEKWYKTKHTQKQLLKQAVYGLPELNRNKIKKTKLIANPGCYATSMILGLYPLLKENIIDINIIIDSKSGVSGAGKKMAMMYLFNEQNENFLPYNVGEHRHIPEVEEVLGNIPKITFVPHLTPITRGIISTIYCTPKKEISYNKIHKIFEKYYKNENFIRILKEGVFPSAKNVANTNFCDIGIKYLKETNKLIIITGIDNLIKGASGQAVQNMNIILNFNESEGLK